MPTIWSSRLRRLMPSLVLALWLAPQLLLAGHGHWLSDRATPDCEICLQLTAATPAVDTSTTPPAAIATAHAVEFIEPSFHACHEAMATCRGPPSFPQSHQSLSL